MAAAVLRGFGRLVGFALLHDGPEFALGAGYRDRDFPIGCLVWMALFRRKRQEASPAETAAENGRFRHGGRNVNPRAIAKCLQETTYLPQLFRKVIHGLGSLSCRSVAWFKTLVTVKQQK